MPGPNNNISSIADSQTFLPAISAKDLVVTLSKSQTWHIPPSATVFGTQDSTYLGTCYGFMTGRQVKSVPVYIATLRNVIVAPSGLVFLENGSLLYESVFPWELDNFMGQFSNDVEVTANGEYVARLPSHLYNAELAFHAREGGETGYFHFINSILPRVGLLKRLHPSTSMEVLISTRQTFASEMLGMLDVTSSPLNEKWVKVDTLLFASPFIERGDHFTRPPFGSTLIKEVLADIRPAPSRAGRRLYLSRNDAKVRRLSNEAEIVDIARSFGFEPITIDQMGIRQQMEVFAEASHLLSAHGAGLSNMVFMPEGSTVVEIVSPSRLWPTFRTLAARHGRSYHAVIGESFNSASTEEIGRGNEDFICNPSMLKMSLGQVFS